MSADRSAIDSAVEAQALALFTEALEQPAQAQQAWIEAQDAPEAVREGALSLLQREQGGGGEFLLRQQGIDPVDRSGELLGKYRLLERIGGGGMGSVYRAERADGAFAQQVAVKLIRTGLISDELLERFYAERQILAKLEHPGIARLIDGGADALGMPFVVMELVDGLPIDLYCRQQALDLGARLQLLQRVCEALQAAHDQGVVHRDLKPGNLLVTAAGQPKLLDFGIAKVLMGDGLGTPLPHTRTGMSAMTPAYASPEQVRGTAVDARSDIYALGVLMFELLTGSHPYPLDSLVPGALERIICDTLPPNPSSAVLRQRQPPPAGLSRARGLSRQLRGDVDRIVMTALHKDSTQRYRSAVALGEDIGRYLAGQPVRARGASRLYRMGKLITRHRSATAALAFAFLVLLGALATVSMQARRTAEQRDLAQAQAARAASAQAFLVELIGHADPFESSGSATLVGAIRRSLPGIEERFAGQPQLEAEMRYAIGYALQNLGEFELARSQLERALELSQARADRLQSARSHDALGLVDWWASDYRASEQHFQAALALLGEVEEPAYKTMRMETLTNFSGMLSEPGEYQRAVRMAELAIAESHRHPQPPADVLSIAWNNLATAQESLGHYEAALQSFDQALKLRRSTDGEMHPDYASTVNNLAFLHMELGRPGEATEHFQKAVTIWREILPPQHPDLAVGLLNLAWAQTRGRQFVEAERNANEALAICRASYADNHPRIGKAEQTLASLYLDWGRPEQARSHAQRALAVYAAAAEVNPSWIETAQAVLDATSD